MPDVNPATWSDATVNDKAREELGREKFLLGQLRALEDLCYDDVRALGLITAGGDRIFQPELTCLSLPWRSPSGMSHRTFGMLL